MLLLFPARFAHVRYSSRMIDRFLNWGDHGKPKSGKIKDRCQPPPGLNKIQLPTVWCSIFYICSKQTMNIFFHCTFAWICADFSYHTAFISYHVMIAKTRVLKCCFLLFDWTDTQLSFETWLAYDDFREKTRLDHGTKTTSLPKRLRYPKSFSHVLLTSRVGYHDGKPIESVVYCLNNSQVYNYLVVL